MKNTKIIIIGLLVVLLMGILVGCPTEAPKEKEKKGDGGGESSEVALVSETIRAGFAVFSYSKSTAGQLGFMVTASVEAFPGVAAAEKIADDFLGDAALRGGYYIRNYTAGQTRQVFISMTNKADSITKIDTNADKIADILLDRKKDNGSNAGVLLVPNTAYTLHVYDYSNQNLTSRDFRTTESYEPIKVKDGASIEIEGAVALATLDIDMIKADGADTLREPVVLSGYMKPYTDTEPYTGTASFVLDEIVETTCTPTTCVTDEKDSNYFSSSNNFIMAFITKPNNVTKIYISHAIATGVESVFFNITYKNE